MRSRATISILIFLLLCIVTDAQEGKAPQLIVPLASMGFVAFNTEMVPTSLPKGPVSSSDIQPIVTPQALLDENNVIHRVLVDNGGSFIFGYDLVIEPLAISKQFKIYVKPLSPDFEQQLRTRQSFMKQRIQPVPNISTLPHSTDAQTIDDGDAFALDLLVNPQTGIKIVDVVKVSFDQSRLRVAPSSPARDFTLDNVELAIRDYRLLVNGEQIGGGKRTSGCAGALIWFYVPNQGRFIFSLIPREGYDFQKVGVIEDNRVLFTLGDKRYEWISSSPIIGRGGTWNLWVLLDPDYVPDFYSPTETSSNASNIRKPESGLNARLDPQQFPLTIVRNASPIKPQSQSAPEPDKSLRHTRVVIGAAERVENLNLPRKK